MENETTKVSKNVTLEFLKPLIAEDEDCILPLMPESASEYHFYRSNFVVG